MSAMAASVVAAPARDAPGFEPRDIALIVGSFVVTRLALVAVGLLALWNASPAGTAISLADLVVQWDSYWYLTIVEHGYTTVEYGTPGATNYAFYPLYPLLMWSLSSLTGLSAMLAGVLISNASFVGALFVLFALALRWSGDRAVAGLAVLLLCVVPEGFIFSAVYTESLFLLLTTAAVLLYERRQYFWAGMCAGLSSAVRSNGVLIVVYFGFALLRERGIGETLRFWREPERYLPIVMAPIGLFAFWWMSMLTVGDAFAQKSTVLHGWPWSTDWPWANIVRHLLSSDGRDVFLVVASLLMFAASLTLLRRSTWPLFAYCLANFALYWTSTSSNSLLRYAVALFPIYFGLALWLAPRRVAGAVMVAGFALIELFLMGLWALGSAVVL